MHVTSYKSPIVYTKKQLTRIYSLSDLPQLGSHKKTGQMNDPHRLSVK